MKTLFTYIFVIVLLAINAYSAHGESFSFQDLKQKIVENPDSVLNVLSNIEKSGKNIIPDYKIALLKGIAYNEKRNFLLAEKAAKEVLASDSIDNNEKEKLNALTLLSTAQTYFGRYTESIATLSEAMKLARSSGNLAGELNILLTMAQTSFETGNRARGYEYIEQMISRGGASRDVRVLANVSSGYGVKVVELFTDDKFEEALAEGKKRLEIIDRIDKLGGAPDGYTDQQRAYTYARIASCAQYAGKNDEARSAYEAFNKTTYASTPAGRAYIVDYLLKAKDWEKVLAATAPLYPILLQGDTINSDFSSLLSSEAMAMAGMGNYKEAYDLSMRAAAIKDSLVNRENTMRAQELSTIFALNETDINLLQTKAELQRKQILLIVAVVFLILVIIILIMLYKSYKKSVREQKIAAKRVDEIIERNQIDEKIRGEIREEETNNQKLFIEMQSKLLNSDIFKNSNFNRENIVACTGLSRSKVISLIELFTGLTPNEYINKLRVEHSVKLIHEHPDWTIDAIAEECGYVRRATFYSHFNKFFGITPAQYRKQKKE
ncbi:MAG: helix-turn-helix domain-containing protein [Muribaculaceae bacterium]|nr:helix-turn-helix domain-containing protein [Muribaculaceae bacterium]